MSHIRAVTHGPRHHFFGYYGVNVWDASGRYLLCLEVDFADRRPRADDIAGICLIDTAEDNTLRRIAETTAWNFQQGSLLHWRGPSGDREIIYNIREGDRFYGVIHDVASDRQRRLERPVYEPAHHGRLALSTNFSRLNQMRPGYGYEGPDDPYADDLTPAEDGIYAIDLETGAAVLIISLAQVAEQLGIGGQKKLWFNHLMFNTDDSRFVFLARYSGPSRDGNAPLVTSMFTANPDGSELYCLARHQMVSHFDWLNPGQLLAWAEKPSHGDAYYLITDRSEEFEFVGPNLPDEDGHCCYSPDRRWILTDTYPDEERKRTLVLYDTQTGRRTDVGRLDAPLAVHAGVVDCRIDLHPRWRADGKAVCFDSSMDGSRQMYLADVTNIVDAN